MIDDAGTMNRPRHLAGAVLVAALALASCGGSDAQRSAGSTPSTNGKGLIAQVASYELVADRDQRFIVGLFSNDLGMVSFGTVEVAFSYLGTSEEPGEAERRGEPVTAEFLPIPGQELSGAATGPRYTSPAEARGVYGVESVRFDAPGFWQVEVTAELGGRRQTATAAFEVGDETQVPLPGEPAPRTENLLPGDADAPPQAVDSRADDDGTVPDPSLHATTVAASIAAGRPVMVVVSTPVFCVSRFCGPITDTVDELAQRYGDRMEFVHLEVWRNFENTVMNKAAAEWIWPDRQGDAAEPWVFLVGPDGVITDRWDNVATEASLTSAVERTVGGPP